MTLAKIISGGQTGVDRGALDAAIAASFPCGGWCPPGRRAEDGPIPGRYPLAEMPRGRCGARTLQNIVDSDGTVIVHFGQLEGGTEQTHRHCVRLGKPHLLVDADRVETARAYIRVMSFIALHNIATLNVAGPRASKAPSAQAYSFKVVARVLRPPTRTVRLIMVATKVNARRARERVAMSAKAADLNP